MDTDTPPPAFTRRLVPTLLTSTPTARRAFRCRCGRPVFFRNDVCLACGTPLGYDPDLVLLRPLAPTRNPQVFRAMRTRGIGKTAPLTTYRRCINWNSAAPCNTPWTAPPSTRSSTRRGAIRPA